MQYILAVYFESVMQLVTHTHTPQIYTHLNSIEYYFKLSLYIFIYGCSSALIECNYLYFSPPIITVTYTQAISRYYYSRQEMISRVCIIKLPKKSQESEREISINVPAYLAVEIKKNQVNNHYALKKKCTSFAK